jgi:uncharacterized membrane protein
MKGLKGAASGIIYISSFFWTCVLTFKYVDLTFIIVSIGALLTNIIIGLLLAADSYRRIFYKWLISLPVGIITLLVYRETNFIYYWINRIDPEYGRLSAGGNFALFFYMIFYLFSFVIAVFIAAAITSKKIKGGDKNERDCD